ncbi:MAG: PbsX family transcriptional regulator [Thalassobaculum sp.]|uniref:AbrB/MazE/SpoVT family DNA-binding domain-containing protein n=1 Tax=Thalassobaculum sp. TaxID=2022740 RepID=UPI0032EEBACC
MKSRIGTWGGSCALRLPKFAVETLGLHEGQTVDLQIERDALVIRRARPAYALEDLVAEAKALTPPDPLDDAPVGREAL